MNVSMKKRIIFMMRLQAVCSMLPAAPTYMHAMSSTGTPYGEVVRRLRQLHAEHEKEINRNIDIVGAVRKDRDGNVCIEMYGSVSWQLIVEYQKYALPGQNYCLYEFNNGCITHDSSTQRLFRRMKKRYQAQYDVNK